MNEIKQQVQGARRRMVFQQFLTVAPWCLFIGLLIAGIGLSVPKIWFIGVDSNTWLAAWLAGGLAGGLLLATSLTFFRRYGHMDAAIEIDKRFHLKERVSSVLSLAPEERETEAGQALIADASRRVEMVSVKDGFGLSTSWTASLPLLPAILVFVLATLVPNAEQESAEAAGKTSAINHKLKKSAEEMRKRMAKRRQDAKEKGLKDAEDLFNKLHQGLNDFESEDGVDRKKALVKMNDLAKEIEKRRSVLGDSEKMKQQFSSLKNIERGPAEKVAKALKEGNFDKAMEELKQLAEKMKQGQLSDKEKEQLSKQLKEMQQKMRDLADAHEDAKRELERQIKQKMAEGDLESASKLQQKLDQLEKQNSQMERMQRMSDMMGKASEALENGDQQSAMSQMEQMAEELEDLQSEMDELQSLDEIMDEISQAKDELREQGMSDQLSQMGGMMDQFSDMPGDGLGQGTGLGYRPEQETETGEYRARERVTPKKGEAVRVGDAFGPNRAGLSMEEVKDQIISALNNDADPLTDQSLPKSQRNHVKQYYERMNK